MPPLPSPEAEDCCSTFFGSTLKLRRAPKLLLRPVPSADDAAPKLWRALMLCEPRPDSNETDAAAHAEAAGLTVGLHPGAEDVGSASWASAGSAGRVVPPPLLILPLSADKTAGACVAVTAAAAAATVVAALHRGVEDVQSAPSMTSATLYVCDMTQCNSKRAMWSPWAATQHAGGIAVLQRWEVAVAVARSCWQ